MTIFVTAEVGFGCGALVTTEPGFDVDGTVTAGTGLGGGWLVMEGGTLITAEG